MKPDDPAERTARKAPSISEFRRSVGQSGLRRIMEFHVFQEVKNTPREHRADLITVRDSYRQEAIDQYKKVLAALDLVENETVAGDAYVALSALIQTLTGMMIAIPPRGMHNVVRNETLRGNNEKSQAAKAPRAAIIRTKVESALSRHPEFSSTAKILEKDPEISCFALKRGTLRKKVSEIRLLIVGNA